MHELNDPTSTPPLTSSLPEDTPDTSSLTTWLQVEEAARLLLDHVRQLPPNKAPINIILANQILALLVTGYETYCEGRFIELLLSGAPIDFARLDQKLVHKAKQEALPPLPAGLPPDRPAAKAIIRRYRINFQDYENGRRAYNAAFGIRFGALALPNSTLEALQRYLLYRHRIIHVSPMVTVLNQPDVPPAVPVLAGYEVADAALTTFMAFIMALHAATCAIRP